MQTRGPPDFLDMLPMLSLGLEDGVEVEQVGSEEARRCREQVQAQAKQVQKQVLEQVRKQCMSVSSVSTGVPHE